MRLSSRPARSLPKNIAYGQTITNVKQLKKGPLRLSLKKASVPSGENKGNFFSAFPWPCQAVALSRFWRRSKSGCPENLKSGVNEVCFYKPELDPTYA